MKFYFLLLSILFVMESYAQNCDIMIEKISQNGRLLEMSIQNNLKCPGYRVELETFDKRRIIYRVNFLPKIVDNAPPEGFSVFENQMKDFESVGVDTHLRVIRVSKLYLDPSTKIFDKDNSKMVRWRFVMDNPNIIKKIVINIKNQKITLRKLDANECGIVYNYLATQPAYGKGAWEDRLISFNTFNDWCNNRWQIYEKNSLIEKIFDTSSKAIKHLKKDKNWCIAELLERGKNISKHYLKEEGECQIEVGLLYPSHYLDPLWSGEFVVKKLNKEPFEIKAKGGSVKVNRGVYVIYIIDKYIDGISEVINCKGGKVHVYIAVNPHI